MPSIAAVKTARTTVFMGLATLAIALAAVAWAGYTMYSLAGTQRTEGVVTVVGLGKNDSGRVTYTIDGTTYTARINGNALLQSYDRGERIPVAYDPANPAHGRAADFSSLYLGPLLFGGFGLLCTALLAWAHVSNKRKAKSDDWLRRNGLSAQIPTEQLRINVSHDRFNRPYSWRVQTDWYYPGSTQGMPVDSGQLSIDPGPFLAARPTVTLYYDPANPAHNYLDIYGDPNLEGPRTTP